MQAEDAHNEKFNLFTKNKEFLSQEYALPQWHC